MLLLPRSLGSVVSTLLQEAMGQLEMAPHKANAVAGDRLEQGTNMHITEAVCPVKWKSKKHNWDDMRKSNSAKDNGNQGRCPGCGRAGSHIL